MDRRNFLVTFILWVFSFFFGYKFGNLTNTKEVMPDKSRVDVINRNIINIRDSPYYAKGDGISDDTQSILKAIRDWEAIGLEGGQLEIPSGRYIISSSLNLRNYFTQLYPYQRKIFNMAPDAEFIADRNISNLINIETVKGSQFLCCTFNIGSLNMNGKTGEALRVVNSNDSKFNITQLIKAKGAGLLIDQTGSLPEGCFNNIWDIQKIGENTTGLEVLGSPYEHPYGFQGNIMRVGQIFKNFNGVVIDSNQPGNSVLNTFHIGVVEFNTGAGIIDKQGSNTWFVGNTSENKNGGFVLVPGAIGIPYIHGVFNDGIHLNNQLARIVNLGSPIGKVPAPSVPNSGVSIRNPFSSNMRVHIKGDGLSRVDIGGIDTLTTVGIYIIAPSEEITLIYSKPPEWVWFGM